MLRYKILLLFVFGFAVTRSQTPCPLQRPCVCTKSTVAPDKRVIDCRSHQSSDLDIILKNKSSSNELFYELALQDCGITSIGARQFEGLRFQKLELSGNSIANVNVDAFSGIESDLTMIYLQGDGNIPIPFQQMRNLLNLKEISFDTFKQNYIDSTTKFEYFPNVEKLQLSNTNINYILSSSFDGKLTNIKELTVTHNRGLSEFPKPAIDKLRTLTHLKWNFNDMKAVKTEAFSQLTNLKELDLGSNSIKQLESSWYTGITNNLEFLNLHDNKLNATSIQTLGIPDWPKLHQLNLGLNNFRSIPDHLFSKMPELAYLGLTTNKLTELKRSYFTGLRNMHSLGAHENEISSLEREVFADMPLLNRVDLESQTGVLYLSPESMIGATGLESLQLSNTILYEDQAWSTIRTLTNLTELLLKDTNVTYIPDLVFRNHNKLKTLDLSKNKITNITQASLHGLAESLESLYLTDNAITSIGKCVLEGFTKIGSFELLLGGNNFVCDCRMIWLHDWIQGKIQENPGDAEFIKQSVKAMCAQPLPLNNQNIADVNRNELRCDNNYVPQPCEDFTTTAIPTTTTPAPSTTPVVKPLINFDIANFGYNFITASWAVTGDQTNLLQFVVSYQKTGDSNAKEVKFPVDKRETDYRIDNLQSDSNYQICLEGVIQNASSIILCRTQRTVMEPGYTGAVTSKPGGSSDNVAVIIAVVVGAVVAVVVFIAIFVVFIKYRRPVQKEPPTFAVTFTRTPTDAPRVGYDSKRFSKPKKPSANGVVNINTISDGKHVDNSRISAGSYQNINPNAQVSGNPKAMESYPDKPNSGTQVHDLKGLHTKIPFSQNPHHAEPSSKSRYVNTPGTKKSQAPKKPHYVNGNPSNAYMEPTDHYANSVETRPLPKAPKQPLSDTSSGFLNHGFTHSPPSSPPYINAPESVYNTPSDSVYNELTYDSSTVV